MDPVTQPFGLNRLARLIARNPADTGFMVYGDLSSPDYVAGTAGWIIAADGSVEFNDAVFRGEIESTSGTIGGFTIGATTLTAGSGDSAIRIDSAGSIIIGNATLGANDSTVVGSGYTEVVGYSPNYYALLSGLAGKLVMGTWTYSGSYNKSIVVEINGVTGDYQSLGGVMTLKNGSAATRITLDGTNGDGTFVGVVRANSKFNHNGTDGITDTIDLTTATSISVSGGIITAWS